MSRKTKLAISATVTGVISIALNVIPMCYYLIKAFIAGETAEKLVLGATCTISIILVLFNILLKAKIRSPLWIALLGIVYVLPQIEVLLIMMSVSTVIDEFVVTPLHKSFKTKYTIQKELGKV